MEVSQEVVQTMRQLRPVLWDDMNNMLQGKVYNPFSVYDGIFRQLRKILTAVGKTIDAFEQRVADLCLLYENAANRQQIYVCYCGMMDFFDEIRDLAISTGKQFGIIRRSEPVPGIGSHIITNLGQIEAVLEAGQIPVIDTVYAKNVLQDISIERNTNAWELYFAQPLGLGLSDIPQDAQITVWDGLPKEMPYYDMDFMTNPYLQKKWRRRAQKYLKLSTSLQHNIEQKKQNTPFRDTNRILGVLCRGTDYTAIRPYNHPVQPTPEEVICRARERMELYHLEKIYLATEDEQIRKRFMTEFGECVFDTQELYYDQVQDELLTQINRERQVDTHQKNMEYLTALALLGKCPYFLGGRTSGTVVSMLLSEEQTQFETWNYGRYGVDDAWQIR